MPVQPPPTICLAVFWWLLGTLSLAFTETLLMMTGARAFGRLLKESFYIPCWACLLLFVGCLQKAVPTRLLNISLLTLLLSPFAIWGQGSHNCYLMAMALIWHLALFLQYFHFSSFLAYGTYRECTDKLKSKSLQIRFFMLYLVIAPFLGDLVAKLCLGLKNTYDFQLFLPGILSQSFTSNVNVCIIAFFFFVFSYFLVWSMSQFLGERK